MNDPRNLRVFGADFDYTARSPDIATMTEYLARHSNAILRIQADDSCVQEELAIRDAAIDFFKAELDHLVFLVGAFTASTRVAQSIKQAGEEVPAFMEAAVLDLFQELERVAQV